MLEFLGRFVVDVLLQGLLGLIEAIGYALTRLIVPAVTGGGIKVAPLVGHLVLVRRWHGLHRLTDGTPVIGEGLAGLVGIVLIAVFAAAVIMVVRYV
jgi:hypothetical protein